MISQIIVVLFYSMNYAGMAEATALLRELEPIPSAGTEIVISNRTVKINEDHLVFTRSVVEDHFENGHGLSESLHIKPHEIVYNQFLHRPLLGLELGVRNKRFNTRDFNAIRYATKHKGLNEFPETTLHLGLLRTATNPNHSGWFVFPDGAPEIIAADYLDPRATRMAKMLLQQRAYV